MSSEPVGKREDEIRPRRSFSGFSGVVPTQMTTAPAREPKRKCTLECDKKEVVVMLVWPLIVAYFKMRAVRRGLA